jgi:hypothetical protein
MNTDRLERIATNMENWDDYMTKLTRPVKTFNLTVWSCGTHACAAGAVAMDPAFNAEGLYLKQYEDTPSFVPQYNNLSGFHAMAEFLDISHDDAANFFNPTRYECFLERRIHVTPQMVATRIRAYIEEHKPVAPVPPTPVKNLGFNFFKSWIDLLPRHSATKRETQLV